MKFLLNFTYGLLIILTVIFVAEMAFPQSADEFAFSVDGFGAKPWSFFTAIFVHADLEHLVANLVVLWMFGLAAEHELGFRRMLIIFILGGIAGQILSTVIYPYDVLSLGASAGIFALIGVAIFVRPIELDTNGWNGMTSMPLIFLAMMYVVYNIIGIFSGPSDISYGAHFAGLGVGLVFGWHYRRKFSQSKHS